MKTLDLQNNKEKEKAKNIIGVFAISTVLNKNSEIKIEKKIMLWYSRLLIKSI